MRVYKQRGRRKSKGGSDSSSSVSRFVTDRRSLVEVVAVDSVLFQISSVGSVLGLGSDFLCSKEQRTVVSGRKDMAQRNDFMTYLRR